MDIIKSTNYNQIDLISDIIKLHVPQGFIDCDCTYSVGNFYKDGKIKEPLYKFDINPTNENVIKADCRNLPLQKESLSCIIYDPPFLATTGKSLKTNTGNIINRRFGVYPNEKELHQFYIDSLKELYRILKKDGILIVKCQDKISSGKQYMSHIFIYNEAIKIGFYPKDLFILIAKNRIVANWQIQNQKNARKYHSYFWVFQKNNMKIEYV